MTRTPGIFEAFPDTSNSSCGVLRFRSLHGLVIIPEKPPVGVVIWKVLSVSGIEW